MSNNKNQTSSSGESQDRRTFLAWLGASLAGLSAALFAIPIVSYVVAPFTRTDREYWRTIGPVHSFETGTTVAVSFMNAQSTPWSGSFAKTAAWLQCHSETEFVAYAIDCTHLGCPVRWVTESKLFMCPCHGGVYYQDGTVAAGPPPRPLSRYPVRIRKGQVEIKTAPIPMA